MAQKKQPYNWARVKPGNIISFKYKSKSTGKNYVQTILVLNPKLQVKLKDGSTTKHLIGIKLEQSNKIQLRLTKRQITLLEKIGQFARIDEKNNLYALEIDKRFILNDIKGVKPEAYNKISKSLGIQGQYRTYDWMRARKSAVFLEPVRVFTKVPDVLQDDETSVPSQPEKPEQPKKPKTEIKKPKQPKKPEGGN
jgi:hypothetical protein